MLILGPTEQLCEWAYETLSQHFRFKTSWSAKDLSGTQHSPKPIPINDIIGSVGYIDRSTNGSSISLQAVEDRLHL